MSIAPFQLCECGYSNVSLLILSTKSPKEDY